MAQKKSDRNAPTTYEQFRNMSLWLAKGFEKQPRNDAEMFRQSFSAVGKTLIFVGWIYAKTLGFIIRRVKNMFGRGKKKDDNSPAFIPLHLQRQMQAAGYPPYGGPPMQQPVQQQPYPAVQPYPYAPQPVSQQYQPEPQPAQRPVQPVRQPAEPVDFQYSEPAKSARRQLPAPPQPYASSPVPNVVEELMLANISVGEHIKITDERLALIENYLASVSQLLAQMQGLQPAGNKTVRFPKR